MIRLLKKKSRMLLLDDDPSMQRLVTALLRKDGHRVDVVATGSQAIELMKSNEYDALLLDVMTPTEGGLTVIRHLREEKPELVKRVILVTGTTDSVLRGVAGDVFAVVHKPFKAQELLSTIDRLLAS
jgi:DNA-binding response OmpR family regulator